MLATVVNVTATAHCDTGDFGLTEVFQPVSVTMTASAKEM